MKLLIGIVLFVLGLFSCSEEIVTQIAENKVTSTIELNETFELGYGESAIIEGTTINIKFTDVIEDSICRAVCVWAGRLVIKLTVGDAVLDLASLNNSSSDTINEIIIGSYRITFIESRSIPANYGMSNLDEYAVALKVEKV